MSKDPSTTIVIPAPTHVKVGSTVTVTIGRNIAGSDAVPMLGNLWDDFSAMVSHVLRDQLSPDILNTFDGRGSWEGVEEDSRIIVAAMTTYPANPHTLRRMLANVARMFGQDAVALSIGSGELVES